MRRVQFIELHDQPWFPSSLRDEITDALQFGLRFSKAYAPIAPLLQGVLDASKSQWIVDLCSGGGGPWLNLSRTLQADGQTLHVLLTDRFPSVSAAQHVEAASETQLAFYPDPVDARNVPSQLKGFRTMFTSFHHFPPNEARAILQNAVDANRGIGIFEITRRAPSTIALMFPWVFLLFLLTPWIRPFRWSQLFWTYVLPVIPAVLLFDGVVSCLRTYRPEELKKMVEKLTASKYEWEVGEHSTGPRGIPITYLMGYPRGQGQTSSCEN